MESFSFQIIYTEVAEYNVTRVQASGSEEVIPVITFRASARGGYIRSQSRNAIVVIIVYYYFITVYYVRAPVCVHVWGEANIGNTGK